MDRSLPQPQRPRRPHSNRLDLRQDRGRQPRRRHVQRLLEVRPLERVGLVEDRQHLQTASAQQPLDRHLRAGQVALQQQRRPGRLLSGGQDPPDALGGQACLLGVIRPDHPAAARQPQRLDDARKAHLARHRRDVGSKGQQREARLRDARLRERPAHRRLVARAGDGGRRVVGQPEALGAQRRGHHALIIDAHDRGERSLPRTLGDLLGRHCRVRQAHGQRTLAHRRRHRRPTLGRHRDRDPELPRRRQEVRRPVGGRRQDQEQAVHGAIVDRWSTHPQPSSPSRHRPLSGCASSAPPRPTRAIACCPYGSRAPPTASTSARYRSSRRLRSAPATPCSTRGISPSWWPTTASTSCAAPPSTGARTGWAAGSWSSTRTSRRPQPLALPTLPMSPGAGRPGPPPGPPRPSPTGGLDTDLARRVTAVLDRDINPSIASHGGHAELAAVEGATAYLRLGGGCQGCGMATVTLSQGIEVAITQAVPEIDPGRRRHRPRLRHQPLFRARQEIARHHRRRRAFRVGGAGRRVRRPGRGLGHRRVPRGGGTWAGRGRDVTSNRRR